MIFNLTVADFGMPACGRGRVASVRALADAPRAAATGTIPGPSAWSPPT